MSPDAAAHFFISNGALVRVLADYLAIAQNRDNFLTVRISPVIPATRSIHRINPKSQILKKENLSTESIQNLKSKNGK
ncbi:hypothetical protein [Tychonema sp. LEGE 07203]|uniref:hypothetical protein n=1 Tax=Tychonema sp. LEGE 07203 TaxID=1828671 RepID=UPI001D14CA45|nr:hypothetical protein [Tychonema sp. LEGE 07203]